MVRESSSTPYERNSSPRVAMNLDAAESQPALPFNSDVLVRVPTSALQHERTLPAYPVKDKMSNSADTQQGNTC